MDAKQAHRDMPGGRPASRIPMRKRHASKPP